MSLQADTRPNRQELGYPEGGRCCTGRFELEYVWRQVVVGRVEVRKLLAGGDAVEVGPLRIRALHTPGHTPGSTCWQIEGADGAIFSGDTVFVNACGRCDLRGGDPQQMYQSLKKISELDPATRLYPGHDYGDVPVSTVQRERERNPYFTRLASLPEFVAHRMRPRR